MGRTLLIDTNVLVRCSRGRARDRLRALRAAAVRLATTDRNAEELARKLIEVFGFDDESAWAEVDRVLAVIEIVGLREYGHLRPSAESRLGQGGRSDWPALAAALALDADIWSDDRDFFGVGVPVWSTANVRFAPGDAA